MSSECIEVNQIGLSAENGRVVLEGGNVVARTADGATIEDLAGWPVDLVDVAPEQQVRLSITPAVARLLLEFLPKVVAEAENPVEQRGNVYWVRFDRS